MPAEADNVEDLRSLLPSFSRNKKFEKRQKFAAKKRKIEESREWSAVRKEKKAKKEKEAVDKKKKAAKKSETEAPKDKKKKASASLTTTAAKKKKVLKPKTTVANAKTGRETLVKKKARELVKEKKVQKKQEKLAKAKKAAAAESMHKAEDEEQQQQEAAPLVELSPEEVERMLIERTIRGNDFGVDQSTASSSSLMRNDPTLYPDQLAFFDDYAERKRAETVSEDNLLENAHKYFKEFGAKERKINQAAARYLREMKEVNRRGGDKDGFRYVVPRNVKQVVRQMMSNQHGGGQGADIDPDMLVSTFGGDGVKETSDKPVRTHRKRSSTYSDFYQFQVSKRWTRNAENFLNRGRANKSLFEAKKKQRSIRKL